MQTLSIMACYLAALARRRLGAQAPSARLLSDRGALSLEWIVIAGIVFAAAVAAGVIFSNAISAETAKLP